MQRMSANEKVKPTWSLRSLKTTAHTFYMSVLNFITSIIPYQTVFSASAYLSTDWRVEAG